jgi:hypothetical protein
MLQQPSFGGNTGTAGQTVKCGERVCQCDGQGFMPVVDQKACVRCSDTCTNNDPCFYREAPGNRCLPAQGCSLYICQCDQPGWMTAKQGTTCTQCLNPCESGDHCLSTNNPGNQCL